MPPYEYIDRVCKAYEYSVSCRFRLELIEFSVIATIVALGIAFGMAFCVAATFHQDS